MWDELQDHLPYVFGILTGLIGLCLFFLIRSVRDTRGRRLEERLLVAEDEDLRTLVPNAPRKYQMESILANTGLELTADQALAWMFFLGTLIGASLFFATGQWAFGLLGFGVGSLLVFASFFFFKAQYRAKLRSQLPDTLYLLARSLRAGLSLEQAIALVANQGLPPLSVEFRRCVSQIQLGLSIPQALESMAQRLQLLEFNIFVSAISLFQSTGGNLPMLLDRLAASTRDRLNFRSYFRSATALGRISAYAIACAAPMFFLGYAYMEPAYVQTFFESRLGTLLLGTAITLEIIGLIWVHYLLKIEY